MNQGDSTDAILQLFNEPDILIKVIDHPGMCQYEVAFVTPDNGSGVRWFDYALVGKAHHRRRVS